MSNVKEINLGYVDFLRRQNQGGKRSPNATPERRTLRLRFGLWRHAVFNTVILPTLRTLGLLVVGSTFEIWLRVSLYVTRSRPTQLTNAAIDCVDKFVAQYPFHLYPIVCKAFELACLSHELSNLNKDTSIVEVAIGEGTLSARVFPEHVSVVGLDLSPYSLKKASQKTHVRQAIVCDCMAPPIRPGSFDVLVANNFLHHVTHKEATLAVWSRIAKKTFFNENTPYWASCWTVPYVLKKLGRKESAARVASQIERDLLQSLESKETLDTIINRHYKILRSVSYMSEHTFFYCSIFSYLIGSYGAPTPSWMKDLSRSRYLGWLIVPLTIDLAKLFIRYDQYQDRTRDAFISYSCESRNYVPDTLENPLACPDCGAALTISNECIACVREYTYKDGMLFLLAKELKDLQLEYSHEISAQTPEEHL
jgi:ubiquinone/menaquinone biosynthesis C-methylase UbiE